MCPDRVVYVLQIKKLCYIQQLILCKLLKYSEVQGKV